MKELTFSVRTDYDNVYDIIIVADMIGWIDG